MTPTHIFTNGCSFITKRPKEGVDTHVGIELAKLMKLKEARHFGAGGRGNKGSVSLLKFGVRKIQFWQEVVSL